MPAGGSRDHQKVTKMKRSIPRKRINDVTAKVGVFCFAALALAVNASGDRVDDYVRQQMILRHLPGVSLATVQAGKIVKAAGYGVASLELDAPATEKTVYKTAIEWLADEPIGTHHFNLDPALARLRRFRLATPGGARFLTLRLSREGRLLGVSRSDLTLEGPPLPACGERVGVRGQVSVADRPYYRYSITATVIVMSKQTESSLPAALTPAVFHIMLALVDGPLHGYAIMQAVEADAGPDLRMGPGTIYGSLQRMQDAGLVREVKPEGRGRRRFTLTRSDGRPSRPKPAGCCGWPTPCARES